MREACVLAIPSDKYGDEIAALIVGDKDLTDAELQAFTGDKLSSYKVPRVWKFLDDIPRNHMGKINKKQLVQEMFEKDEKDVKDERDVKDEKKLQELTSIEDFQTAFTKEVAKNEKFIVIFNGNFSLACVGAKADIDRVVD